ncbi:MAG TPA: hypothetical protein VGZ22_28005 [Isosphaeraceae bacterium]|jgi:hypothetical protein|nr:hypothetical protein [Isosphaeraceae bacterium]
MSAHATVICTFRVKSGGEGEFIELLRRHWPKLHSLGLATADKPVHYQGHEKSGGPIFFEIFSWVSEQASREAHQHPEVMAIWEPMGALCEPREGRPPMEFPHVQPLVIDGQT